MTGHEIIPYKFPSEAILTRAVEPHVTSQSLSDYYVLQGGIPLDVYQRAELSALETRRLQSLYDSIRNLVAPYHQAIRTTALMQATFFQEQESLQRHPVKYNPNSIVYRMHQLIQTLVLNRLKPRTVKRASEWFQKDGDNYVTHVLNFREDQRQQPPQIVIGSYSTLISKDRGGEPFASTQFIYSPSGNLNAISTARIDCHTQPFVDLIQDKIGKSEIVSLTHPRGDSFYPNREYPQSSSADFTFNLNGLPNLEIIQTTHEGVSYGLELDSEFIYNPSADLFIRTWDRHNLGIAHQYQLSTKGEMSTDEYLAILKGLIFVPLQNIAKISDRK